MPTFERRVTEKETVEVENVEFKDLEIERDRHDGSFCVTTTVRIFHEHGKDIKTVRQSFDSAEDLPSDYHKLVVDARNNAKEQLINH